VKINRRGKLRCVTNLHKSTKFVCSLKRNALISELIRMNETKQTVFLLISLLHRACCRVTQLLHQVLHMYKIYKIYTLKY